MKKNILITGLPKGGKSTLIKKVISEYDNKFGFVTEEISSQKKRTGFEIELYTGQRVLLASIDLKTDYQVSKYFVDIKALDSMVSQLSGFHDKDILYLDEIGPMELFSDKFKKLALNFLDSKNICLVTVKAISKDAFIKQIKKRKDIISVNITERNRNDKSLFNKELIKKIKKAKRYINEPERFIIKNGTVKVKSEHGVRTININNKEMNCNCDFFIKHKACSHSIAAEEIIDQSKFKK